MADIVLKCRVKLEQEEFQFSLHVPGEETIKLLKARFLESIRSRELEDRIFLYLDKEGSVTYLSDNQEISEAFKEVQAVVAEVRRRETSKAGTKCVGTERQKHIGLLNALEVCVGETGIWTMTTETAGAEGGRYAKSSL